MKIQKMPHMLSEEMKSIARQHTNPTTLGELVLEAQAAISRAQTLIVDQPQDPNSAMLELNLAYGLLETIDQGFTIGTLDTQFGD